MSIFLYSSTSACEGSKITHFVSEVNPGIILYLLSLGCTAIKFQAGWVLIFLGPLSEESILKLSNSVDISDIATSRFSFNLLS